jgi:hypothetical protein
MASQPEINDITEKVKEYAELSKTIKVIQEKLKLLNKKKKELYKEVLPKLKTSNVSKCNLAFGTLKVIKTKRKVTPNKTSMKDKYISFFNTRALEQDYLTGTPEQKADILFKYIYTDCIEYREDQSISMTYNKEFKDQFKQFKE